MKPARSPERLVNLRRLPGPLGPQAEEIPPGRGTASKILEVVPISAPRPLSAALYAEARQHMPGGVSSPVRAFAAVGGEPLVFASGAGPWITDVDGHAYLDLVGSWGPLILGHAHPEIVEAVCQAARQGLSFGATCPTEIELAREIRGAFPTMDLVRLVSSGTEATMSALRLARGFTGRNSLVKFEGCYHGHSDGLLVKAGSGATTFGTPDSAGVPAEVARHTVTLPFNDADALERLLASRGSDIAAVILEPVAGNMGLIPPVEGFLQRVRDLTSRHGILLVFDEVMTGFRLAFGGAQELYGIRPDLTCLGKIVGGGMPIGAYGGRRDLMEHVAPLGPVYQAGTLSGNPLSVAAGLTTLRLLRQRPEIYQHLEEAGARLEAGLQQSARRHGVPVRMQRVGSMLTWFFTDRPVRNLSEARTCDTRAFGRFFQGMLDRGVYLPPSQFEAAFLSAALGEAEVERLLEAVDETLAEMAGL
jgi:glutamate-1-semialdehyde 2,1-aminomutase